MQDEMTEAGSLEPLKQGEETLGIGTRGLWGPCCFNRKYSRGHNQWFQIGRWRILPGHHLGVDIAVEFIIYVVISDVLQGGTARCAFETFDV